MRSVRRVGVASGLVVLSVAVAACGSRSDTSSSSAATPKPAATADVSAARALVAQYSGKPTAFPVDAPLTKRLGSGQKLAFLQCGTPYCALLGQLFGAATKLMGVKLDVVKGGGSSESLQTALSSISAKKPSALLVDGVNLSSLGGSLAEVGKSLPVVVSAIHGTKADGISQDVNGKAAVTLGGRLLADWTIVNAGPKAKVTWYTIPELDFTKAETVGFQAEMAKSCASCQVRVNDVPVASIGSSAPSRVVSDLQAHPGQDVVLFASQEAATGLPVALKTAGIKVKVGGYAPTPANLQDIKNSTEDVAVGLDAGIMAFTQVDAAARLATGQPQTKGEQAQTPVLQLLTKADLPGDVSKGWSGYPDFAQRFAKLWTNAK